MRRLFGLEPLASADFVEGSRGGAAFQRLAWALAFFHALVQARACHSSQALASFLPAMLLAHRM